MKKSFLLMILAVAIAAPALKAQEYYTIKPFAVGLRGSYDGIGGNFRYFCNDLVSLEVQLNASGGKPNGTPLSSGKSLTGVGLVQLNFPLYTNDFRFFLGVGMHYGTWERYKDVSVAQGVFGFDGILGFEYTFPSMPVSVSLDFKPAMSYIGGVTYFPNNIAGLGIRYYFGKWKTTAEKEKRRK